MMKTELLYGVHPVLEALSAGRRVFHELFLLDGGISQRVETIARKAASQKIPLRRVKSARLKRMTRDEHHQGVAARVGPYPIVDLVTLMTPVATTAAQRSMVLLDTIADPQNLGAIVRTALGVGAAGVVICRDRAAAPTPAVSRASAGALEHVRLVRVTNMAAAIRTLQRAGWWVFGMDHNAETSVFGVDLTGPVAIVIGGEEKGIRPLVKRACDMLLSIPQSGPVGSLNASAAAAVALYAVFCQGTGETRGGRP
jgi:23S rRNA (guanosine2251-2'-O)-methyltransferase